MRARLDSMKSGEEFHFLCVAKMADRMAPVIGEGGGELIGRDDRSYGVVMSVRKR